MVHLATHTLVTCPGNPKWDQYYQLAAVIFALSAAVLSLNDGGNGVILQLLFLFVWKHPSPLSTDEYSKPLYMVWWLFSEPVYFAKCLLECFQTVFTC